MGFPFVRTGWPDHCPTSQFEDEIGFFQEFLLKKNVLFCEYYLGFDCHLAEQFWLPLWWEWSSQSVLTKLMEIALCKTQIFKAVVSVRQKGDEMENNEHRILHIPWRFKLWRAAKFPMDAGRARSLLFWTFKTWKI